MSPSTAPKAKDATGCRRPPAHCRGAADPRP